MRGLGIIVIFMLAVTLLLVGAYFILRSRQPVKPVVEYDISKTPGAWYTYSRTVGSAEDPRTEVGIQFVANKDSRVLERRAMSYVDPSRSQYSTELDRAQDRAYEAQRVANLSVVRR